jgi:hypothetical protein
VIISLRPDSGLRHVFLGVAGIIGFSGLNETGLSIAGTAGPVSAVGPVMPSFENGLPVPEGFMTLLMIGRHTLQYISSYDQQWVQRVDGLLAANPLDNFHLQATARGGRSVVWESGAADSPDYPRIAHRQAGEWDHGAIMPVDWRGNLVLTQGGILRMDSLPPVEVQSRYNDGSPYSGTALVGGRWIEWRRWPLGRALTFPADPNRGQLFENWFANLGTALVPVPAVITDGAQLTAVVSVSQDGSGGHWIMNDGSNYGSWIADGNKFRAFTPDGAQVASGRLYDFGNGVAGWGNLGDSDIEFTAWKFNFPSGADERLDGMNLSVLPAIRPWIHDGVTLHTRTHFVLKYLGEPAQNIGPGEIYRIFQRAYLAAGGADQPFGVSVFDLNNLSGMFTKSRYEGEKYIGGLNPAQRPISLDYFQLFGESGNGSTRSSSPVGPGFTKSANSSNALADLATIGILLMSGALSAAFSFEVGGLQDAGLFFLFLAHRRTIDPQEASKLFAHSENKQDIQAQRMLAIEQWKQSFGLGYSRISRGQAWRAADNLIELFKQYQSLLLSDQEWFKFMFEDYLGVVRFHYQERIGKAAGDLKALKERYPEAILESISGLKKFAKLVRQVPKLLNGLNDNELLHLFSSQSPNPVMMLNKAKEEREKIHIELDTMISRVGELVGEARVIQTEGLGQVKLLDLFRKHGGIVQEVLKELFMPRDALKRSIGKTDKPLLFYQTTGLIEENFSRIGQEEKLDKLVEAYRVTKPNAFPWLWLLKDPELLEAFEVRLAGKYLEEMGQLPHSITRASLKTPLARLGGKSIESLLRRHYEKYYKHGQKARAAKLAEKEVRDIFDKAIRLKNSRSTFEALRDDTA